MKYFLVSYFENNIFAGEVSMNDIKLNIYDEELNIHAKTSNALSGNNITSLSQAHEVVYVMQNIFWLKYMTSGQNVIPQTIGNLKLLSSSFFIFVSPPSILYVIKSIHQNLSVP
jgi:hypothetical protein